MTASVDHGRKHQSGGPASENCNLAAILVVFVEGKSVLQSATMSQLH